MQKINNKNFEKAKIAFKNYIDSKNIKEKLAQKLTDISTCYPGVFSKEINYIIDNLENLFYADEAFIKQSVETLSELNKEMLTTREHINDNNKKQCVAYEIRKIFENAYEYFSYKRYGSAIEFVDSLNIVACPYCNLNSIIIYDYRGYKVRPHLDHYYSKSLYPYLALSYRNLIPCCPVCNSELKGDKDFWIAQHCHPYFENFDDIAEFIVDIYSPLIFSNPKTLHIDLVSKKYKQIYQLKLENIKSTFRLKIRYNSRPDSIIDELLKRKIYTQAYQDKLYKLLKNCGNDISPKKFDNELKEYIFDANKISKYPLAKLIKDILA